MCITKEQNQELTQHVEKLVRVDVSGSACVLTQPDAATLQNGPSISEVVQDLEPETQFKNDLVVRERYDRSHAFGLHLVAR